MKPFNFFLSALPLLLLVSCAGGSPPTESPQSVQDKKTEMCTNLARLNTSVAALKSLSPSSTVGDLKKAQDQVKTAFGEVKRSAQTVQAAKAGELDKAYENLEKAIQAIPNTATLQQARQSISPQVAAVEAAEAQLKAGLSCP